MKRGGFVAVKRIAEEKPTNFEKITIEFNMLYNQLLACVRDRKTRPAQVRYMRLCSLYTKIMEENMTKQQKEIMETRMKDATSLIPSDFVVYYGKNEKI